MATRGRRYVDIEAGHCARNVYLQAVALGLGATEAGAFDDAPDAARRYGLSRLDMRFARDWFTAPAP